MYNGENSGLMLFIIIIESRIMYVEDSIKIIDSILMVWLGVSDTKYENITNIPPI